MWTFCVLGPRLAKLHSRRNAANAVATKSLDYSAMGCSLTRRSTYPFQRKLSSRLSLHAALLFVSTSLTRRRCAHVGSLNFATSIRQKALVSVATRQLAPSHAVSSMRLVSQTWSGIYISNCEYMPLWGTCFPKKEPPAPVLSFG
jgi:hypothetical protein